MRFVPCQCFLFFLQNHQVFQKDNEDAIGDEIVFLADGEATDDIKGCSQAAIDSGAIIHTLALGPKVDGELIKMANKTGT